MKNYCIAFLLVLIYSCSLDKPNQHKVKSISAMKNVMWKGELEAKLNHPALEVQGFLYTGLKVLLLLTQV